MGGAPLKTTALRNSFSEMTTVVGEGIGDGESVGVGVGLSPGVVVRVAASVGDVERPATPEPSWFDAAELLPIPR